VANETRDEALALLSPGEAESLVDLLHRVHVNLSERVPLGAGRPAILAAPRASAAARIANVAPEATIARTVPAVETAQ